jgi:hypothetical protein
MKDNKLELKLLDKIASIDWIIGYELTAKQQEEIYDIKHEAFEYLDLIGYYDK